MGWQKPPVVRLFGRPRGFDVECPRCGRLLLVGRGRPDDKYYNRVSGILTCPLIRQRTSTRALTDRPGCGLRVLVGLVLYPLRPSRATGRPADQRPDWAQLQELRALAGVQWRPAAKGRGAALNRVEAVDVDLADELGDAEPVEHLDREPKEE